MGVDLWQVKYKYIGRYRSEIYENLFKLFLNEELDTICISDKENALKVISEMDFDGDDELKKEFVKVVRKMKEGEDYRVF